VRVLRPRPGYPPLASPSLCLRAREAEGVRYRSLQPEIRRAGTNRFSSSLSFPRAGPSSGTRRAVVPLRATHPGKPRRSASPYGACLATRRESPLYAFSRVSRPRRLLLRARLALARGREAPAFAGALRTSTEPAAISPRAVRFRVFYARSRPTRDDFTTSDVGRGLRDEGPVRAHSSREWNAAGAPPRWKAPCTLCHRPGCMRGWSCRACLGNANPERPRSSFLPPPAKEEAAPKTRVLGTAP